MALIRDIANKDCADVSMVYLPKKKCTQYLFKTLGEIKSSITLDEFEMTIIDNTFVVTQYN